MPLCFVGMVSKNSECLQKNVTMRGLTPKGGAMTWFSIAGCLGLGILEITL
jgi:hypothetical protein